MEHQKLWIRWRRITNPHRGGYGKNKGKNKGYKPAAAPPAPTPYNPWAGAIQMWPMPQPAGHGILGPRPGPRANAFMASTHAGHVSTYGMATYGTPPGVVHGAPYGSSYSAPYGAPFTGTVSHTVPSASAQSWDTSALAQHFNNLTLQPPPLKYVFDSGATTHLVKDSGATAHLINDAGILSFLSPHPIYHHVIIGDGSPIPVSSSGHASFPSFFPNPPLHLRDVLVTPRIIKNLISVRQFTTDNNCSIDFDPFGFSVKDLLTRRELLRCNSTGELYTFSARRPVLSLPPPPLMIHGTVASIIPVMTLIVVFHSIFLYDTSKTYQLSQTLLLLFLL
jgi:hypothetical protein